MVKGISSLRQANKRLAQKMKLTGLSATKEVAEEHARLMKPLVPIEEADLLNSIRVAPLGDEGVSARKSKSGRQYLKYGHSVIYGNDKTVVENSRGVAFQNARIQEFGTKTRQATPALFPTYRANKRRFKARITKAMRLAAKFG